MNLPEIFLKLPPALVVYRPREQLSLHTRPLRRSSTKPQAWPTSSIGYHPSALFWSKCQIRQDASPFCFLLTFDARCLKRTSSIIRAQTDRCMHMTAVLPAQRLRSAPCEYTCRRRNGLSPYNIHVILRLCFSLFSFGLSSLSLSLSSVPGRSSGTYASWMIQSRLQRHGADG
ncbi:hypothetical protein K504DRAFT_242067 [Pleomassaria siparia CBS 279.74]|uniref:Uncharacterized protein n=1 Tax=Pleomassaria siparia CBS 279.74 TaxID=1314801 RepID=A0A6G1KDZ1_9PLEO|nr:hypothetical protein K504DRAFT_242067 [Pleomassaria siparia CBS 279.74]